MIYKIYIYITLAGIIGWPILAMPMAMDAIDLTRNEDMNYRQGLMDLIVSLFQNQNVIYIKISNQ